ncbi:MAG: tetratricopeptide repeat protein [Vicinamibacterales bacterium]
MGDYLPLLASLVALLIGLIVGKAWERYKLRDGRWHDRRRLRATPHYMLGLTFFVQGQVDQAIEELTHVTASDADALEIEMILGNLLREKGQVARAITIHQTLLQRPSLGRIEHAHVLLCLGLDFRHAGFIDRAIEAFTEVRRLDPGNRYALLHLQKLYEEQHQWEDALRVREAIVALSPEANGDDSEALGFLHNEIGKAQREGGDAKLSHQSFVRAIEADTRTAPAYLNLGDLRETQGDIKGAVDAWEQLARSLPDRAGIAFERLERGYRALGLPQRFAEYCERTIEQNPLDWRTRLALARHRGAQGQHDAAFELLLQALTHNPHGLAIHQEVWTTLMALHLRPELVQQYVALTRNSVFYLDPHVCMKCHYRSTELLWLCPHCHEWNTFVEERIAPLVGSE